MALSTAPAEAPVHPIHNLLLAVAEVIDPNEAGPYLEYRYRLCQPGAEGAQALVPVGLPNTCPPADLPAWDAETLRANQIEAHKACLRAAADYYFPLFPGEEVCEDSFTYLVDTFHSAAAGSPVLLRTTTKAVLVAVAQQWKFSPDLRTLTFVPQLQIPAVLEFRVSAEPAQAITKIIICFAGLLPGPAGTLAKTGIELISYALGIAGEKQPGYDEMKAIIRDVVREELVSNDLEKIRAGFEAIRVWSDVTYLAAKRAPHQDVKRLRRLVDEQIAHLERDLEILLMENHRRAGFPLLMIGIPIYLSLLQESLSLGVPQDLCAAAEIWAKKALSAWDRVKQDRYKDIVVKYESFTSGAPPFMLTHEQYRWIDKVEGREAGPFQDDKHTGGKAKCNRSRDSHYADVIGRLNAKLGDVEASVAAWRKAGTCSKL